MILVQMLGIGLVLVFLYGVCSLPYVLVKLAFMKRNGANVWTFLSWDRLIVMAGALLVGGQVPWLFGILVMAAGASGSGGGPSDEFWLAAKALSVVLSISGFIFLTLLILRPRDVKQQRAPLGESSPASSQENGEDVTRKNV
jgi:membrane-bound ClpP family serine protease